MDSGLAKSKGNDPMWGIVWGDADLDAISLDDFNPVFLHPPGEYAPDDDLVITLYLHGPTA